MIESKHDINFPDVVIEVPAKLEEKTINASIEGSIIVPDEGYDGLSKVNINKIDNVKSEYIKNGIDILGVKGSLIGLIPEKITLKSGLEDTYIYPSFGKTGITEIKLEKQNLGALNPTENGTYLAENFGLDGFNEVNVNVIIPILEEIEINEDRKTFLAEEGKAYNKINVDCTYYWWYDHIIKSDVRLTDYIKQIPEVFDFEGVTSIANFYDIYNGEIINVNFVNTNKIISINTLFGSFTNTADNLKVVNIENFDTSNVKYAQTVFRNCHNLNNIIGFENLIFSNLTNTSNMFNGCEKLSEIKFNRNINLTKITEMEGMFYYCPKLEKIDLSMFTGENVKTVKNLFGGCSKLMNINLSNFDFSNITDYQYMFQNVPNNCYILCKDETNKDWITSKFTNLTNVHYVGE